MKIKNDKNEWKYVATVLQNFHNKLMKDISLQLQSIKIKF